MRRFVVYFPGRAGLDGKAWEDVGFSLVEAETGLEAEKQPDVVFWRRSRENSLPSFLI